MENQKMTDGKTSQIKPNTIGFAIGGQRMDFSTFQKESKKALAKISKQPCCIDCGETERRVLTQSRGKGVWSCWDCDNRDMQEEENRAIASGNHGSCFE